MKIEIKNKNNLVPFKTIKIMDWFRHFDRYYIKIQSETSRALVTLHALRQDGYLAHFDPDTLVVPYESTLTLEEK